MFAIMKPDTFTFMRGDYCSYLVIVLFRAHLEVLLFAFHFLGSSTELLLHLLLKIHQLLVCPAIPTPDALIYVPADL
jgi:hypothetical protein